LHIGAGGIPGGVQFAGIVAAGEYRFNVVVPALPDGGQPVTADIGGVAAQPGLSMPIQNRTLPWVFMPAIACFARYFAGPDADMLVLASPHGQSIACVRISVRSNANEPRRQSYSNRQQS
jgi:hypothetical protein